MVCIGVTRDVERRDHHKEWDRKYYMEKMSVKDNFSCLKNYNSNNNVYVTHSLYSIFNMYNRCIYVTRP